VGEAAIVSFQPEETLCAVVKISKGGRNDMIFSRSSVVLNTAFRLASVAMLRVMRRDISDAGGCFLVAFATRDLYTLGGAYVFFANSASLREVDFVAGCWLVILRFY
jgi:hypothetical protein